MQLHTQRWCRKKMETEKKQLRLIQFLPGIAWFLFVFKPGQQSFCLDFSAGFQRKQVKILIFKVCRNHFSQTVFRYICFDDRQYNGIQYHT
jgi:hypothetical protein